MKKRWVAAVLAGMISEGSECVTLPENADLYKEAEDFRGKKIGCFRMETGHMVMKGYLREHGLEPDVDVQYVYLDSQASIAEAVKKERLIWALSTAGSAMLRREMSCLQ